MSALLNGLTLYCIALGLVQLSFLVGTGVLETRRARRILRSGTRPGWSPDAVFALVPCLDEADVIGPTVTALLAQHPALEVVVIDDDSDDDTAGQARHAGGDRVTVLTRRRPDARLGKGPALNHGLAHVVAAAAERGLEPSRVLLIVMDADGRLSEGALAEVGDLFHDPAVGGAQIGVRIRNRRDNLLATIQDCEFWGIAALGQMGRIRTGTVSLGGNGQFTRLSALLGQGEEPWTRSLTEDLDLAVSLAVSGWRLTSTPDAWVTQQGLTRVRPLLRQRSRWFQGHMTTATTRLGEVWRSRELANVAVLEMTSYLLIPFLIVLPWSILSQVGLISTLTHLGDLGPAGPDGPIGPPWLLPTLVWYVMSFAPTLLCGALYSRREPDISLVRAIAFSHLLVLWNYVLFAACWWAVVRMLRGSTGWVKTARVPEAVEPSGATLSPVGSSVVTADPR